MAVKANTALPRAFIRQSGTRLDSACKEEQLWHIVSFPGDSTTYYYFNGNLIGACRGKDSRRHDVRAWARGEAPTPRHNGGVEGMNEVKASIFLVASDSYCQISRVLDNQQCDTPQ